VLLIVSLADVGKLCHMFNPALEPPRTTLKILTSGIPVHPPERPEKYPCIFLKTHANVTLRSSKRSNETGSSLRTRISWLEWQHTSTGSWSYVLCSSLDLRNRLPSGRHSNPDRSLSRALYLWLAAEAMTNALW